MKERLERITGKKVILKENEVLDDTLKQKVEKKPDLEVVLDKLGYYEEDGYYIVSDYYKRKSFIERYLTKNKIKWEKEEQDQDRLGDDIVVFYIKK